MPHTVCVPNNIVLHLNCAPLASIIKGGLQALLDSHDPDGSKCCAWLAVEPGGVGLNGGGLFEIALLLSQSQPVSRT